MTPNLHEGIKSLVSEGQERKSTEMSGLEETLGHLRAKR